MRQCFSILFEFQVIRKGCILLGPELPTGDGWERAIGVVLHHWRLFFSIRFEFQVIRKGCEGSGDDSWSDAESLCDSEGNSNVKCGEFVSGKRYVAWNVTRDVGWTLGELSGWDWSVKLAEVSVSVDLFLQCPSQVVAESSLCLARRLVRIGEKVVIAELGDWDMHAEHKRYIFKAITKTFDKPESLSAISLVSEIYQGKLMRDK